MDLKDLGKLCEVVVKMADKAEATDYINISEIIEECEKVGIEIEDYDYTKILSMYGNTMANRGKFPETWIVDASGLSIHTTVNA